MPDPQNRPDAPDPSSVERNPLGLGPRDREGSNTGSIDDTSYEARDSDPYETGEPRKNLGERSPRGSSPVDESTPSSDEP